MCLVAHTHYTSDTFQSKLVLLLEIVHGILMKKGQGLGIGSEMGIGNIGQGESN